MHWRALLRFMKNDKEVALCFPSPCYGDLSSTESVNCFLHGFADASFAPYRFNSRRGITGGAVFCEGSLVRTVARQQQSASLSSCEAELYALQAISQEAVAYAAFTHRLYFGIEECEEFEVPRILLESDSASALQLLQGLDIPKRSRHVEIRISWLRSKVELGQLHFVHREGTSNVADMFTKCLGSRDFYRHRKTLGFISLEVPWHDLQLEDSQVFLVSELTRKTEKLAFVELCCSRDSGLQKVCRNAKVPYVGVLDRIQDDDTFERVRMFVESHRQLGYRWIHIHCSTPCSSGSPFQESDGETVSHKQWLPIMSSVGRFLSLGDSRSFELPRNNAIWKRQETKDVLHEAGLNFSADVYLCQTGMKTDAQVPIGKCLRFWSTSARFASVLTRRFGSCDCPRHAGLFEVKWSGTGYYNEVLSKALLYAARASRKDP